MSIQGGRQYIGINNNQKHKASYSKASVLPLTRGKTELQYKAICYQTLVPMTMYHGPSQWCNHTISTPCCLPWLDESRSSFDDLTSSGNGWWFDDVASVANSHGMVPEDSLRTTFHEAALYQLLLHSFGHRRQIGQNNLLHRANYYVQSSQLTKNNLDSPSVPGQSGTLKFLGSNSI